MQEVIQGCSWCYDGCILDVQKVIWHGDRLNYGCRVWIWGGSPLTFIRNCHHFNPNGPQMWKPWLPQTSLPGCNLFSDLLLLNMTRFCRGENWRKQHTHGELLGGGCQEKRTILWFLVAAGTHGDANHCYKTPRCLFPKTKRCTRDTWANVLTPRIREGHLKAMSSAKCKSQCLEFWKPQWANGPSSSNYITFQGDVVLGIASPLDIQPFFLSVVLPLPLCNYWEGYPEVKVKSPTFW